MRLTACLAIGRAGELGYRNTLPWPRLPRDMARFKDVTMSKPVLMGRRTWESLGRPLPGRQIVVVSSTLAAPLPAGVHLARDIPHALSVASAWGPEAIVAGGADLYGALLPQVSRVLLTVVHGVFPADTFAPETLRSTGEPPAGWRNFAPPEHHEPDAKNALAMTFLDLVREGAR